MQRINIKKLIMFTSAFLFFFMSFLNAQIKPQLNENSKYFSGYAADVKGEVFSYHSPLASVNSSLLVRSVSKENYIEWETDPIPADYNSKYASFVWMFGIEAKPESHKFQLFINDKYILTFENPKDTLINTWTIQGADSTQLTFDATLVDRYTDLMGFACLKVPAALYKNNKPLRIRVVGESLNRNTWYMTFRYSINNSIRAYPQAILVNSKEGNMQPVIVEIVHFSEPAAGKINMLGKDYDIKLKKGFNKYTLTAPAVSEPKDVTASYYVNNQVWGKSTIHFMPIKPITIYLLHHSHNDIGYTHVQADVVKMQIKNLKDAITAIEASKNNPINERMKWNSEVLWPVEQYLKNCTPEEIAKLKKAVKEGSIEVNALYANTLTGLCRPEELMQIVEPARKVWQLFGVEPKSAMISDVPGLSWGIVPVLANYGIKYLEIGQNTGDRIGYTLSTWGDKPFYWVSPSGKEKVLCFVAGKGYSFFHAGLNYGKLINPLNEEKLSYYLQELQDEKYPYDIIPVHYTVGSDNGPVHMDLPEIVKAWNEKYASPKIIISTTSNFYKEFEKIYSDQIPAYRGDYTGFWEDGAASTALETAINRRAADRIVQSEILWSIINPKAFPAKEIDEAWENVLLYSEHTWGSWNSMSDPENPFTKQQWAVKRTFPLKADSLSMDLLHKIIPAANTADAIDIYNTNSWTVSGWVMLKSKMDLNNKSLTDKDGKETPYQILKDGSIAIYANDVLPLSSKRYFVNAQKSKLKGDVVLNGNNITNGIITVEADPLTGNINSLTLSGSDYNYVDNSKINGLTDYEYVNGRRPDKIEIASNFKIVKGEDGPFIKSLKIFSDAPGCNSLEKEIIVYSRQADLGLNLTIDRKKVYNPEGVHIAFPFNIPDCTDYINTAWATYRPEYDQLKAACKNYFPVQRFVEVSNQKRGITLVPIDAPMIEIGGIMTDANYFGWQKSIANSPLIYSYIMNNYWGTNYKAEQEGITKFVYSITPHLRTDLSEIEKKSIELNQQLLAVPVNHSAKECGSLFSLSSGKIIVTLIKAGRDGKGFIVHLFNTSAQPEAVSFKWGSFKASGIYFSNPDEKALSKTDNKIEMLPNDIITLKLEK